jgi:nucleoid-associated protein YgaU
MGQLASKDRDAAMAENTRKYGGIAALGLLVVIAGGALLYLASQPTIAPTPPAVPVAKAPAPPVFDVVRVDAQGNVVIAGRAVAGATVTVKADSSLVVGTVPADAQGAFVLVPATPLKPGAHILSLSEKLSDGTVVNGTQTASIDVPAGAGSALTVLNGANGAQVLSGQGPQPGTLGMGTVDYDAHGHAILSGTAPANAQVSINLDGKWLGSTVADGAGRWNLTTQVPATSGMLTLSAKDANGAVLPPVTAPFALETLPTALAEGKIIITPGDCLWLIARHVYGKGTLYTIIYTANASQIHDPNLIFPGQAFALPKPQG